MKRYDMLPSMHCDSLGQEYGLSGSSVARLLWVNELIPEVKEMLDPYDVSTQSRNTGHY